MEPEPMDPAESDAGRPPADKRSGTLPADTSAAWMVGLSGGRPLDNDSQPLTESRPGGGDPPVHAHKDPGAKPLVGNKPGRSALIIPGSTERRTSHAHAPATGSSGPYPGFPSALPARAFDDGVHPGRGVRRRRRRSTTSAPDGRPPCCLDITPPTVRNSWKAPSMANLPSGAGGGFLPSPMMAPPDVPRGFEPPRPYVLGPAESAVVQPAAALHGTPVGQESDFTPAQARFLPDLMIGNQAAARAAVDPSAEPVRRDGALAEPSQRAAMQGGGVRADRCRAFPARTCLTSGLQRRRHRYGDEQDPTALPPRQPVPQVLEVPAMGEDSRSGSPAFWERRHLRRWQTGLLR